MFTEAATDDRWGWKALELSGVQRGRNVLLPHRCRDIVDGEDRTRLHVRGHIIRRRVYAGEVASAQLSKDGKVMSIHLGTGDGVKDADERLSRFADRFDDLVCNQRVLVVEDMGRPTALAEVKVVGAGDGDDVNSGGCGQLSRHGADG